MTWKLLAISDELNGQEFTIDRDLLVGRHQDADIQLQSADISRRHAAFLLKEDALWLQDLKSSNGTFVNDVRIEQDKLLMDGDIVQFASVKFNVLAPVQATEVVEPVAEPAVATASIQQPAEAIATAEIKPAIEPVQPEVEKSAVEKTVAEKMNEGGMPELTERDQNVQLTANGMPTNMGVPKPAPIPKGVDVHAPVIPEACEVNIPETCATQEVESQKNAKVGLITIVTLVILAILAWLFFK